MGTTNDRKSFLNGAVEIGLKKALGATNRNIAGEFFGEMLYARLYLAE